MFSLNLPDWTIYVIFAYFCLIYLVFAVLGHMYAVHEKYVPRLRNFFVVKKIHPIFFPLAILVAEILFLIVLAPLAIVTGITVPAFLGGFIAALGI